MVDAVQGDRELPLEPSPRKPVSRPLRCPATRPAGELPLDPCLEPTCEAEYGAGREEAAAATSNKDKEEVLEEEELGLVSLRERGSLADRMSRSARSAALS